MKNQLLPFVFSVFVTVTAASPAARADIQLPLIFGNDMVLQRDTPDKIWGTAEPGETVVIAFDGATVTSTADLRGKWLAELPAHAAGGPYDLVFKGKNTITLTNVLVGEVWFTTGQSNMNTPVGEIPQDKLAAESVDDYSMIRHWEGGAQMSAKRLDKFDQGSWAVCTPKTVANFSAVPYFFAKELYNQLKVPIGVIHTGRGGSKCESWTSIEGLQEDPAYQKVLKALWEKNEAAYPAALTRYKEETLPRWEKAVTDARAAGQPEPKRPWRPDFGPASARAPAACFNAFVAPLIPYTFRGVLWYQGESNSDTILDAKQYRTLLPNMIADWRYQWKKQDLPFMIVQIANFGAVQTQPVEFESAWAWSREVQTITANTVPHAGMSVSIDVGDAPENIHPHDKVTIGHRAGLVALAKVCGTKIPCSGPMFSGMKVEGGIARVSFDFTDGGLVTRGGGALKGFAIAGKDGDFAWANGKIDGNTVILSSPAVAAPTAVRYNWAQNPIGNLYNGAGLPANPFLTDSGTGALLK